MNVLLLGGTGLVGQSLFQLLQKDPNIKTIHLWVRSVPKNFPENSKGSITAISWERFLLGEIPFPPSIDTIFCCLGTTIAKAGSQDAFRVVDFDIPLQAAKQAKASKIPRFLVVTAMGANAKSSLFYNRVKGELEQNLQSLGLPFLGIVRPSLLLGERKEFRLGEKMGEYLTGWIPFQKMGLSKWKPIPVTVVAKALCQLASKPLSQEPNTYVWENDVLWREGI